MIRVIKYCVSCGILNVNDGNEESFVKDNAGEVLYENTGVSRYFMKNFTQDIMALNMPEDFQKEEWIDVDEDRGVVRRQRVYRRILMSAGLYKDADTEEDFAYVRNYRNMIESDLAEWLDCELHVHRSSAYLVLGENSRLGRTFPEENTLSDVVLLVNYLLCEGIKAGKIQVPLDEQICLPKEQFQRIVEECKVKFCTGFSKMYREMTFAEFYREVYAYMENMGMLEVDFQDIRIKPLAGKIIGIYPEDFMRGKKDES